MKLSTKIFLIMTGLALIVIMILLYHTERFIIPQQEQALINNARSTSVFLKQVAPLLNGAERQNLLETLACANKEISYLLVLDQDGVAINHSNPNRIGMAFNDSGIRTAFLKSMPVEQIWERDPDNPDSPYYKEKVFDIILPYRDAQNNSGIIGVGLSMERLENIRQVYYERILISSLIIIIFIFLLTTILYRHIILPIRNLLQVFREMKSGNYNQMCAVERNDELGILTTEFNSMSILLSQVLKDLETREEELKIARDELEDRVKLRTAQLEENIALLQSTQLALRDSQDALRISEEKFSAAFQFSPQIITLSDFETGRYVDVNEAWLKYTGYKKQDVIGKTSLDINIWCNLEDWNKMQKVLLAGKSNTNVEIYFQNINGVKRPFLCSYITIIIGNEKYILFVANDIHEKKNMEEDLVNQQEKLTEERLKASKLESLGVLAGGLAHDFNNLLTVIKGNLSLTHIYEPSEAIKPFLNEIENATLQAQDLTTQLLTFSKPGLPAKKIISVAELLRKTVNFALSGSNIICTYSIAPNINFVEVDEGQIRQVINNLIINAIQAMPNGGEIKVKANNHVVTEEKSTYWLPYGNYVILIFEDQGCGINENDMIKIFDPYYTTKESGSGLGLATSYAIIRKHEGYITLESELGKGTTFYVYLPAISTCDNIEIENDQHILLGHGKVLVMEDTEVIRNMLGKMLASLGYQAELTKTGQECVDKYNEALLEGEKFDVVLLDLTVPGDWSVTETVQSLLNLDKDAKVILSSGYSNNPLLTSYKKWGFSGVISKPYNINELSNVISNISKNK